MKKSHKVLFLAHSNNDIDHFLPIIYGLNKEGMYDPEMLFLRFEEEAVNNEVHKELLRDLSVDRSSVSDFWEWSFISGSLFRALKNIYTRIEKRPLVELLRGRKIVKAFYKLVYVLLDRLLKRYCEKLFPAEAVNRAMRRIRPAILLIDVQIVELDRPYSDLRSYLLSRMVRFCRDNKIPVFMVLHGVVIRYRTDEDNIFNRGGNYKPDIFALCNERDRLSVRGLTGADVRTPVLGDLRYDKEWVGILESTAKRLYDIKKPGRRLIILYLAGNLRFLNDKDYERDIHRDVVSLLKRYGDAELWIKIHPRVMEDIDMGIEIPKDISSKIKVFRNNVDTNALVPCADIFISTFSGVLFQAIMKGKPVIFYQRWKERFSSPVKTVFDGTPWVLKAANRKELHECVRTILSSGGLDGKEADRFYREAVCGGAGTEGSIIENYVAEIKNALMGRGVS